MAANVEKFFTMGGKGAGPAKTGPGSPLLSGAREGGHTLRKDVFLPSKHLLSALYKTLPSKNPSKNLVCFKAPYRPTGAF